MLAKLFAKKTIIIIVLVLAVGGGITYHYAAKSVSKLNLVAVTRGDITEDVLVTGNTTPVNDVDLGFQVGGNIAAIHVNVGDTVTGNESRGLMASAFTKSALN